MQVRARGCTGLRCLRALREFSCVGLGKLRSSYNVLKVPNLATYNTLRPKVASRA